MVLLCAIYRFAASAYRAALSADRSPAHQSVDRAAIGRTRTF